MTNAQEIVDYWLGLDSKKYYAKDLNFDAELKTRFETDVQKMRSGTYDTWTSSAIGCLAAILLLDQMSRNIYRGTPGMYEGDNQALRIAKEAIKKGYDQSFETPHHGWFYMPFMHAETLEDQEECIRLFKENGPEGNVSYAIDHRDIVKKFGRFPHRNSILGRTSTEDEVQFLEEGGFSG